MKTKRMGTFSMCCRTYYPKFLCKDNFNCKDLKWEAIFSHNLTGLSLTNLSEMGKLDGWFEMVGFFRLVPIVDKKLSSTTQHPVEKVKVKIK